jgi:hypothetical protein
LVATPLLSAATTTATLPAASPTQARASSGSGLSELHVGKCWVGDSLPATLAPLDELKPHTAISEWWLEDPDGPAGGAWRISPETNYVWEQVPSGASGASERIALPRCGKSAVNLRAFFQTFILKHANLPDDDNYKHVVFPILEPFGPSIKILGDGSAVSETASQAMRTEKDNFLHTAHVVAVAIVTMQVRTKVETHGRVALVYFPSSNGRAAALIPFPRDKDTSDRHTFP